MMGNVGSFRERGQLRELCSIKVNERESRVRPVPEGEPGWTHIDFSLGLTHRSVQAAAVASVHCHPQVGHFPRR